MWLFTMRNKADSTDVACLLNRGAKKAIIKKNSNDKMYIGKKDTCTSERPATGHRAQLDIAVSLHANLSINQTAEHSLTGPNSTWREGQKCTARHQPSCLIAL